MALTQPTYAVNNVQTLADLTQDQAAAVKVLFDKTGSDTKAFIIALLAELAKTTAGSSAAENLGSATISGITGNTIYAQIAALLPIAQAAQAGTILPGVVTEAMLAFDPATRSDANRTWYVDTAVSSSGDGLSYATAFKTIAEAIAKLYEYTLINNVFTIYIKPGTYAEPIDIQYLNGVGGVILIPDGGTVTLTGSYDFGGNSKASIYLQAVKTRYLTLGNSATNKFVCSPSSPGSAAHTVVRADYVDSLCTVWYDSDGTSWATTTKYGSYLIASIRVSLIGAISNMTYALSCTGLSKVNSKLTGSGNGVVLQAVGGGQIHIDSAQTITGTTATEKTNGGLIVNANGIIA